MDSPYRSLQLTEARARFDLLEVTSYDVVLDLAGDEKTFTSLTTIDFTSQGGETFVDLKARHVNRITFNGHDLDPSLVVRGRLPLSTDAGENRIVVDAVMPFRNDGEGLHRSVDPADGRHYVYGMSFMDAAPTIFACFDQPDLKAPYTFHVTAPADWSVIGNAPGTKVESSPDRALWEFEQSQPLSTYFVTLVAGPYHVIHDEHAGIPLSISSRQSIAQALEDDADELFTMTKQCFDEFHRIFGIRYPFGNYHQAFVPEFNAGAMENPGCVTFRDPLLFTSRVTRGERIQRATTVAHEMAHQWFGNITTPKWWDDLWLNESFAEYMGNRVTAEVTQYDDAWIHAGHARRQWGLVADQRPSTHPVAGNGAFDATAALQDFDGISYAKGSTILKQLNTRLGDDIFFGGVIDHFERHRFGNATMSDLISSWERAGAGDLSAFTDSWLLTTGADTLVFDRGAGVVRRTPSAGQDQPRDHTVRVALGTSEGWRLQGLAVERDETPLEVPEGAAVLLDPDLATWALPMPDDVSFAGFRDLIASTTDPSLRLGIWNSVRSAFHNALVDPEEVVRLAEQSLPSETNDDALRATLPFLNGQVTAVSRDPVATAGRIHAACRALLQQARPGSTAQLAAFQGAVASSNDAAGLRGWLAGNDLPQGLEIDADLRWRLLVHVATLGETDRAELDRELAEDPTTKARVDHAAAVSSLPDHDAKAWAWARFDGTATASNYELVACGTGLWRGGQEEFTAPYVERYFAELPGVGSVHSGWVLGNVTEHFFPISSLEESTLAQAEALIDRDGLDLTIRRRVVDMADALERRLTIRRTFSTTR